jgi:hypothetical protein
MYRTPFHTREPNKSQWLYIWLLKKYIHTTIYTFILLSWATHTTLIRMDQFLDI